MFGRGKFNPEKTQTIENQQTRGERIAQRKSLLAATRSSSSNTLSKSTGLLQ
jgi:hypothetical protein